MYRAIFGYILLFIWFPLVSQTNLSDSSIVELLKETTWEYEALVQASTGEVLHQRDAKNNLILYFRFDSTAQQRFNEKIKEGRWRVEQGKLYYALQSGSVFEIHHLDEDKLALKFVQANNHFLYTLTRVEDSQNTFKKSKSELPLVEARELHRWKWPTSLQAYREEAFAASKDSSEQEIILELTGGGYYGGIDPVYRDFIRVMPDGKLIFEYKSKERGYIKRFRQIDREQMVKIAQFAKENGFFSLPVAYECTTALCSKRMKREPKPRPLNILVKYGSERKLLTIAIYGEDEYRIKYVSYPAFVDELIDAMRDLAH